MPETAVVHEWIAARAGSEQVFEALAQTFADADLYALSHTPGVHLEVGERPVRTTFLDRPRLRDRRELTLPLMPLAFRALPRRRYDLVLTSHHAFASSNRLVRESGRHLLYVHSPARYVWSPDIDGRGAGPLAGWALRAPRRALQALDRRAVRGVTDIAANSSEVAARIERYWERPARVIHPPVDIGRFAGLAPRPRTYLLALGRWIPYKNMGRVVDVAERLGVPAVIAGSGPEEAALRARAATASVPVTVVRRPSDEQVAELYAGALCLVFPTFEDFGIVPVEAQAAGTPVAALGIGGALDTVVDGVTGAHAPTVEIADLAAAVERAAGCTAEACVAHAARFGTGRFRDEVTAWAHDRPAPGALDPVRPGDRRAADRSDLPR